MRIAKLLPIIALLMTGIFFSACHAGKKNKNKSYTDMLYKELKKELKDADVIRIGDTVRVIYPEIAMFDFGKDQVKNEATPAFKKFAEILKNYNRIYFNINGYTDNVGPDDVNLDLSKRRAENTKTLMQNNGVQAGRMTTSGKGATNFIAENDTPEGKQTNRRVEFILYERKMMK